MNKREIEACLRDPAEQGPVELPFLPSQRLTVTFDSGNVPRPAMVNAVANLGDLGPDFRSILEPKIYEFYLKEIEDGSADFATAQDQIDWENRRGGEFAGVKAANEPGDIWPLVRFYQIVAHGKFNDRITVRVEGNAAWDGEHGVVLNFENGERLARVAGYGYFM